MKGFSIKTEIEEYADFKAYADRHKLSRKDLIFCGRHTYEEYLSPLNLSVQTLFRDSYGKGEPTDAMINAILEDLSDITFDRIIAIGGGTVIDIAKVLSVAARNDRVDDLYEHVDALEKRHALTIIPTTCGTGSEVTAISVINRISKGVKMGLSHEAMLPDHAILITQLLESLPYQVFATSSIDAMVHSVESFLSPNACRLSRIFSEKALRLILSGWKAFTEEGGGDAWKAYGSDFLAASNWAGIGFGYAGCAAVHACAYPLGSVYHIPHGQSNQLMFQDVMKKYAEIQPVGQISHLETLIGEILSVSTQEALPALYQLMDRVLKKEPLRTFGVREEDLPVFAKDVIQTQQRLLKNNYVSLTEAQLLEIYRAAF